MRSWSPAFREHVARRRGPYVLSVCPGDFGEDDTAYVTYLEAEIEALREQAITLDVRAAQALAAAERARQHSRRAGLTAFVLCLAAIISWAGLAAFAGEQRPSFAITATFCAVGNRQDCTKASFRVSARPGDAIDGWCEAKALDLVAADYTFRFLPGGNVVLLPDTVTCTRVS